MKRDEIIAQTLLSLYSISFSWVFSSFNRAFREVALLCIKDILTAQDKTKYLKKTSLRKR